jgi:hypothetical protein
MKFKVEKIVDNADKLENSIKRLTGKDVLVGIPEDETQRKEADGITNAMLAYIHDTGSPSQNIPARPFMDPGIKDAKTRIVARLKKMGEDTLDGNTSAVDKGLDAIGLIAVSAIRAKITSGPFAPLSPSTIRARLRRGFTGEKPLIVTAQLRNAINYVVRKK